jgi:hypothetical protein
MAFVKDSTNSRNKTILKAYEDKLKELGEMARYYPKKNIYSELADLFFMAPDTIGGIIREQIKPK